MTGDLAVRWAGTVVPSWFYRWLMPIAWLGAIVTSVATDVRPCSVDDPTVCGPDRTFALAMTACFASLLLLWWQPIVAAAAGLVFMALDLLYDDVAGARIAWTIYGVLCAAMLLWTYRSRRSQRAVAATVPRQAVHVPAAKPIGVTGRLLAAAGLVAVGAVALGGMHWQTQREAAHVRRAVAQTAVASGVNHDGDLIVRLPDGRTHHLSVADDYATGAQIPILVDPGDPDWLRLRAEPADYTHWYPVAAGASLLAALFVLRDFRLRRSRPRISGSAQGLPVRIEPDASVAFAIRSSDNAVLLGWLDAELDDEEQNQRLLESFSALDEEEQVDAPAKLKEEWEDMLRRYRGEALLVGELVEGSWPTIVQGDRVLRPLRPFRAPRRLPWHTESVAGLPTDVERAAKPALQPARDVPTLPWEVPLEPRPWWLRPALVAVLIAGPIVVGALAIWGEWYAAIVGTAIGAQLVHWLGAPVFYRVIASATDLWIRSSLLERRLPWRSVESVEVEEAGVSLEAGEDYHVVGGVAANERARVAAVFETLRLRARTGLPDQPVVRRPSPLLMINAGFVALCALSLALARTY